MVQSFRRLALEEGEKGKDGKTRGWVERSDGRVEGPFVIGKD